LVDRERGRSYAAIIADARWEYERAVEFKRELLASKRIDERYLQTLAGELATADELLAGVTAIGHERARAASRQAEVAEHLALVLHDIREDFKIAFPDDPLKQKAAGMGLRFDARRPQELLDEAAAVAQMLAAHADDARAAHIDAQHLHDLADFPQALRSAMAEHGTVGADRHDVSAQLAGLVHLLSAQAAHIRLVARRVFKHDPAKLARFASRIPHHAVQHRVKPSEPPPA
jgi:hypothetical protein